MLSNRAACFASHLDKMQAKLRKSFTKVRKLDTGGYNYIGLLLYLSQVANEIVKYCVIWY